MTRELTTKIRDSLLDVIIEIKSSIDAEINMRGILDLLDKKVLVYGEKSADMPPIYRDVQKFKSWQEQEALRAATISPREAVSRLEAIKDLYAIAENSYK